MQRELKKRFYYIAKEIFDSIREEKDLISFVIFGSLARKRFKKGSDIDILMIVKERKRFEDIYLKKYVKIRRSDWPDVDVIIEEEKNLRENPLILLDMIENSIVLLDKNKTFERIIRDLKNKLKELGAKKVKLKRDLWYFDLKPDYKKGDRLEIKI